MEKQEQEAISQLVALLRQKGYRGPKFGLDDPQLGRFTSEAAQCLQRFLALHKQGAWPSGIFNLSFAAPYEDISCRFRITYHARDGFNINQLNVYQNKSGDMRQIQMRHNQELKGIQVLYTLFPKPKPWDNFRKGKFRL